ncbi:MAG: putative sulfate exporter family transporter [Tissierellia bacterium]|nr:putative sulfate exporter family transporter [Tissierellia bacterium]
MKFVKNKGMGILLSVVIAAIASVLSRLSIGNFSMEIVGAPVFSIIIGMLLALILPRLPSSGRYKDGIKFTSKKILQWAVVILGFTLNLGTVAKVGAKSFPIICSTILISLIVSYIMMKVLKIESKVACLIGVGSSICGGSAIAATAPVIDADDEQIARSISVIFLFNVLAALIFPSLGPAIGLGSEGFAVFAGTAVNDTSSVTAAASTAEGIYGVEGILSAAVTVKLTRTLAIIPITLILALHRLRKSKGSQGAESGKSYSIKQIFPFFILFFIAASLVTTLVGASSGAFADFYNAQFVGAAKWLAKFFIAMAMAAIGLNTNIVDLIKEGKRPMLLGLSCWIAIILMSLFVQRITGVFYSNL